MKKRETVNLAEDTAIRIAQSKARASEERVRESEQKFKALFDNAKDAIFIHDLEGRFLDVNREACERLGFSRDELLQMGPREIDIPEFAAMVSARIEEVLRQGHVLFESEHWRRDGSRVSVEINSSLLKVGGKTLVFSTCRDITARKQAEANQVLMTESLKILNRSGDLQSVIRDVIRLIRDATGFDAVGLRLRKGDDCPYYQQDGFSEDFLREENFLCAKRGDGAILHDAEGRAVLECTCGLVLSGRTDPSMSCFTKGGSFWTNRSTDLLALPREEDPRTNPRNNCIHRGYQSVGLFPVRGGEEVIGLLQLNDRREERFTPELIAFYESLAQNIGLALQRTLAEESLHESEERFRTAFENGSIGMALTSLETKLLKVNSAFCRMLGFSEAELVGRSFTQITHPEDSAANLAGLQRIIRGEIPSFRMEKRYICKDGRIIWTDMSTAAVRDAQGRPSYLVTHIQDITERKRAEDALRESEERFSKAFAASPDAIILSRLEDGIIREVNESFVRLFGFEKHEVIGKCSTDLGLLNPADRERALQKLKREGRLQNLEMQIRTRSGEIRWTLCSMEPIEMAGESLLLSIARDITERNRAQEALRESEERLRLAQQAARVGTFEWNLQTDRDVWTPELEAIYGLRPGEFAKTGEAWQQFLHPEDRANVMQLSQQSIQTGELTTGEWRVVWPDGSVHWVVGRWQVFKDTSGQPLRMIGVNLDITARKKTEEALASAKEQLRQHAENLEKAVHERTADLEQTYRALQRENAERKQAEQALQKMIGELEHFSYTITHDMRAPLRAMQGFGSMLLDECAECLHPQRREFIRRIAESAGRMDNLITDALNYSKVVQQELELEPVDAAKLLHGMVESYPEFQLPKAEVTIEDNIPVVMGNAAGLTQCFSNLLGNAVKFVQPGKVPKVRAWAERKGEYVRLWFEDNGIGIAKEHQELIFTMFQQLDKDYEGTGIGLALVRKVVERMKGKVGVESEEGKGSRFWIELKRCE